MKELHREGLANHSGPESCIYIRKSVNEALTGEYAGQPLSCEIQTSREPTLLSEAEGNTQIGNNSESMRVSAQSENLSMHGHFLHGNREILETSGDMSDRLGKATNWLRALKRRSQRNKMNWDRFGKLADLWLPRAKILHPYPEERFYAIYPR